MITALYRIEHETRYRHEGRASTSQHVAYLTPRDLPTQRVLAHELIVEPAPANRAQRTDAFGNTAEHFTIATPYEVMSATGRSTVEVFSFEDAIDPEAGGPWEEVR